MQDAFGSAINGELSGQAVYFLCCMYPALQDGLLVASVPALHHRRASEIYNCVELVGKEVAGA